MANTRLSDLANAVALTVTDFLYIVQTAGVGGVKGTLSQLQEFIQDIVGTMMTDTATIDFVYDDGAGTITGAVKTGSIDSTHIDSTDDYTMNSLALTTALALTEGGTGAITAAAARINIGLELQEGVFTPTLEGSTTAGVHTYSVQQGYYYAIGDMVYFTLYIQLTAKGGTMAGNTEVHGLPFTSRNNTNRFPLLVPIFKDINWTAGYTSTYAIVTNNSTEILLGQQGDNVTQAVIPSSAISSTSGVFLSGTYIKA